MEPSRERAAALGLEAQAILAAGRMQPLRSLGACPCGVVSPDSVVAHPASMASPISAKSNR
jgi:hypothetical protein